MQNLFNFDDILVKPSNEFIKLIESKRDYNHYDYLHSFKSISHVFNDFNSAVINFHSKDHLLHYIPYSAYKELTNYVELKNSYFKSFLSLSDNKPDSFEKYNSYINNIESLRHYIINIYNPSIKNQYLAIFGDGGMNFKKDLYIALEKVPDLIETDGSVFENLFKETLNDYPQLKEKYFQYTWGKNWEEALEKDAWY